MTEHDADEPTGIPVETIDLARAILDGGQPEESWRDLARKIGERLRARFGPVEVAPAYGLAELEQDVLIELDRGKRSLRFEGRDQFWSWVWHVADSKRADARRRQVRDVRLGRVANGVAGDADDGFDWLDGLFDPRIGTPSGDLALDETVKAERDCVRAFARVAWRRVYALRRYCGWDYDVIATRLGYDKVATVRTIASRAQIRVRSCLQKRIGSSLLAAFDARRPDQK